MQELFISSRKNETLREAAKLLVSGEVRREKGLFLAEGARLCRDAVRSGITVKELFYTQSAGEKYPEYIMELREKAEKVFCLADHAGELLSGTKNTQGIFCVCSAGEHEKKEIPYNHCLALENVQDPGNLGTVLRTAEALGVGSVLLCGACCDVFSPKVLRASMGAVFRLPVFFFPSLPAAVAVLDAKGFQTFAAVPESDAFPVTEADFSHPTLMAVGNEGSGLSREAKECCGRKITIPMLGRAESLNAAAAASILMWEMMRGGAPHGAG